MVTLTKVMRLLRARGPRAVLQRSLVRLGDLSRTWSAVRRKPRFQDLPSLLDFVFGPPAAFIQPAQIREEIDGLLRLLEPLRPRTVLEIGTASGGTLFLWTRVAAEDAELFSVDLPGGEFGDGYPAWKCPLYRSFALPGQTVHLLRADSHREESLRTLVAMIGQRPLDFLFIDGDHRYEGVKRDFEMYRPLVRPGGLIAFHDIAKHDGDQCQVRKYWLEVRTRFDSSEIVAAPPAGWAGIGVLRVD
jgi:predicted O-methyltransferase YrrM